MEQELKLQILDPSPAAWTKISQHPLLALGTTSPLQLHAFYYDSRDGALQRARLAYRVRREGKEWVATLKAEGQSTGGLHQRPEWNVTIFSSEADLRVFTDPDAVALLTPFLGLVLQVILETRFERLESRVDRVDGSQILVALDRGEIVANGGLREPILEVELELAAGEAAAVLEMGAELCLDLPLLPDGESKMLRGLRLAGLIPAEVGAMRYQTPPLRRHENAGKAFSRLLIQQSQQAISEARRHSADNSTKTLHQLRKTVRSLRALLRFCRALDADNRLASTAQELADWFHQQNIRRDHEVLAMYWEALATATGSEVIPLHSWLIEQAEATPAHLGQCVAAILKLWARLLRAALYSDQDLQHYAEMHLRRQDRQLMAAGAVAKTATSFHALRIRIKNWRYVIIALGDIWPSKDSKILLKLLSSLQEISGAVHDADMAGQHLAGLATSRKHGLAFSAGMLMGYLHARESRQRKKFSRYWERLENAPRPWG
ncbi:CHAD domain-containing protein [Acidithiobacillus ferriphilus]|uniref:CYTH and CHAD domain-containing protein n=1 Tax=Acidithiobacillus ferriphilus TaxID=1689834 RepID=UPI001C07DAB4|nr:CHAD domain-containing protein [Acidithiobacillus ferriphilus]MBU2845719.1 CHAD domain-containing protein [Acidithiobacillus ferriphilus]